MKKALSNTRTTRKFTLNINDELRVTKALKFGFNFNAYRAELPDADKGVGSAILAAPIATGDGASTGLYHTLPDFQRAQVFNPLVNVELRKEHAINREYRAVGSIYGELDFLQDFNFKAQLYADYGFNTERRYYPPSTVYNPEIVGANKRDTSATATSVTQIPEHLPQNADGLPADL